MRAFAACLLLILMCSHYGLALAQDGGPAASSGDGGPPSVSAPDGGGTSDGGAARDGGSSDASAEAGSGRPAPPPIPAERMPEVSATLSANTVELGALLTLSLDVTYQAGDRIHLKGVRRLGAFEVIKRRREEHTEGHGEKIELDIMSFEIGPQTVPPIKVMVVLRDGQTGSLDTEEMTVEVTDPLANEPDPQARDDHDPFRVLKTDKRALWTLGIIGGLLLAGLLGILIGHLRSKRKPKPLPPPPPPRPPEEVALEKLREVEHSTLLEDGEVKAFHIAVSEAVREYLGGRYDFDSLELTTEELLEQLDQVTIRGSSREEIVGFLRETDMVKFAKWRPETEHSRVLLKEAYEIVQRTTRAEVLFGLQSQPKKKAGSAGSDGAASSGGPDAKAQSARPAPAGSAATIHESQPEASATDSESQPKASPAVGMVLDTSTDGQPADQPRAESSQRDEDAK